MIETYIFKTIISFISLNAVMSFTKENWLKMNPKKNGFLKRNFNKLIPCLIPVFRWIHIMIVLVIGIALGDYEFREKMKERTKK